MHPAVNLVVTFYHLSNHNYLWKIYWKINFDVFILISVASLFLFYLFGVYLFQNAYMFWNNLSQNIIPLQSTYRSALYPTAILKYTLRFRDTSSTALWVCNNGRVACTWIWGGQSLHRRLRYAVATATMICTIKYTGTDLCRKLT